MFGGIVEAIGVIKTAAEQASCKHFTIELQQMFDDLKIGDSVSVNGVCLTVTRLQEKSFNCSAVPETLALTNLSKRGPGARVNLERALRVNDRIGGHYVQGHVDGTAEICAIETQGAAQRVTLRIAPALARYLVKKGYVALDGMSITLVEAQDDQFCVTLIPHTREVTIANDYRVGSQLNVEVDILGKYAEKLLEARHARIF